MLEVGNTVEHMMVDMLVVVEVVPLSSEVVEEDPSSQPEVLAAHSIEERKEAACSSASSLAFVVALDYSRQACMQGSRILDIQVGTVVELVLELEALQLVEACSIGVRKMVDSLASLVEVEAVAACSIEVHMMAGSLASLVEVVVEEEVQFHSTLAVVDIELDKSTVVLEEVLD